jgi:hypothetical protein
VKFWYILAKVAVASGQRLQDAGVTRIGEAAEQGVHISRCRETERQPLVEAMSAE